MAKVENCGQYENCEQCIDSLDIYCGWCVLESRSVKVLIDLTNKNKFFATKFVANPACQTTLGYSPVAVHLVGGGAASHSRLV